MDIFISLETIVRKCRVVFATEDDPFDLIHRQKLNKELYFLCRYKIQKYEIEPVFSGTSEFESTQIQVMSASPKQKSPIELKSPEHLIHHNSLSSRRRISYSDSKNYKSGKENSPKGSAKKVERNSILSPYQKKSVKRNLNDSFADIDDSQSDTPVANYSIINDNADSDKPLKLKLRLSQKKSPCVIVDKLDETVLSTYLEKLKFADENKQKPKISDKNEPKLKVANKNEQKQQDTPTLGAVRRSCRAVQRISYAELISPEKFTPTKHGRNKSTESLTEPHNTENKTPRSRRKSTKPKRYDSSEFLIAGSHTPSKKAKQIEVTTTPNKRAVKSPRKDTEECSTSPRKLRRISTLIHDIPTRRSILKLNSDCNTPSKRVTLVENIASSKTPNTKTATPKSVKVTPSNRARLIREGIISPSVQKRDKAVKKGDTPLMKARGQLHVSYVPNSLPCREKEYENILNFLQGKLADGCGG